MTEFFIRTLDIAGHLRNITSEDWAAYSPPSDARIMSYIVHPDGRKIYLESGAKQRIFVTGAYPTNTRLGSGITSYFLTIGKKAPMITCAETKENWEIARAISELFLPQYNDLYGKCKALVDQDADKIIKSSKQAKIVKELVELFNSSAAVNLEVRPPEHDQGRYHKADVRVTGNGLNSICIYDLSPQMFERICRFLADYDLPYIH